MQSGIIPYILSYLSCAVMAFAVVLAALPSIHAFQLESYQGKMYLKWLFKRLSSEWIPYLIAGIAAFALRMCYIFFAAVYPMLATVCYYGADVVYAVLLALMFISWNKKEKKKKLVFTGRIKRLAVALFILAFLFEVFFFITFTSEYYIPLEYYIMTYAARYLPAMLLPFFVLLAYIATYPIEEAIKKWYFNDAKKKLESSPCKKIAITGSYGKTSTKYALGSILAQKYDVLFTPGSFNTPMGVTRVIRESLTPDHEVFIAEMGARYKGDVAELCKLVQPYIGILTSIGEQHLETFGSIENVVSTKAELLNGLQPGGACFLNGDNAYCEKLYSDSNSERKYLFGLDADGLYMKAEDIAVTCEGSEFTLVCQDESIRAKTKLLGRTNILNICGAAACARYMGLTLDEIKRGIETLEPVEHRLQLIEGAVTVIDDAFNSNPVGSAEALEVLKSFSGRRIIVTPGMVELGDKEAELNRAFGVHMADCVDIAILVGKEHIAPIREGLIEAGFDEGCIVSCATLTQATELMKNYTSPGCVVLFENDLPDNYNE